METARVESVTAAWRYVPVRSRVRPESQPFTIDEWEPVIVEAPDLIRRRTAKAHAAGKEIRLDKVRTERQLTADMLVRLATLRKELRAALLVETEFRRFQLERLIADVDRLMLKTRRDVLVDARSAYERAARLGSEHVDQPLIVADTGLVTAAAGFDARLVTVAFDNTADLLSDGMRQFRSKIVGAARRISLGVDSFGDNMVTLANEIADDGLDNPEYRAERTLRTEVSRTFNTATHDRQIELADRMPFLRKAWIRVSDTRTRESHVHAGATYARGKGLALRDRFKVGRALLRFPVDPLAEPAGRVAASETIMCRCLGAVDFDPVELARASASRVRLALS